MVGPSNTKYFFISRIMKVLLYKSSIGEIYNSMCNINAKN